MTFLSARLKHRSLAALAAAACCLWAFSAAGSPRAVLRGRSDPKFLQPVGVTKFGPIHFIVDRDNDGIDDAWEAAHNLTVGAGTAGEDPDHDGLTNLQEYRLGLDPHNADTDGDGSSDGDELLAGSNPLNVNDFPSQAPVALQVTPPNAQLVVNDMDRVGTLQLLVEGKYPDGSTRNLTAGRFLTNYTSSNPTLAAVSPDGLVSSSSSTPGSVTITVTRGALTATAKVEIRRFSPSRLGLIRTNGIASSIQVIGRRMYVADGAAGLTVVDLADRDFVGSVGHPPRLLASTSDTTATDLRVLGNRAYVVGGGFLQIYDVSEPSGSLPSNWKPTRLASTAIAATNLTLYRPGLLLVANGATFRLLNVSGDSAVEVASLTLTSGSPGLCQSLDMQGDIAVATMSSEELAFFKLTPTSVSLASTLALPHVRRAIVSGNTVYAAIFNAANLGDAGSGLRVISIADPVHPTIAGFYYQEFGGALQAMELTRFGGLLFVLNKARPENVRIFNAEIDTSATCPACPTYIARVQYQETLKPLLRLQVDELYTYAARGDAGVEIGQYRSLFSGAMPAIQLTAPTTGQIIHETEGIHASVTVSQQQLVKEVQFILDGQIMARRTAPPYEFQVPSPEVHGASEQHIVSARAVTYQGAIASTLDVPVTVEETVDTTPPVLSMMIPKDGSLVYEGQAIQFVANASDNLAVAQVTVEIGGQLLPSGLFDYPPIYNIYGTVPAPSTPGQDQVEVIIRARDYADNVTTVVQHLRYIPETASPVTGTTITATDTSWEGKDLLVRSPLQIDGSHTFRNIFVTNGGVLTHGAQSTTGINALDIHVTETLYVAYGGLIDVSGKGYLGGLSGTNSSAAGRTAGNVAAGSDWVAGSHGGVGGRPGEQSATTATNAYDSFSSPSEPGAGGGSACVPCPVSICNVTCRGHGGNGGGVVTLTAHELILYGNLQANAESYQTVGYIAGFGGAGGSVNLNVDTLLLSGQIQALGRGGGAGGRIAIQYQTAEPPVDLTRITASAEDPTPATYPSLAPIAVGGTGTVYLHSPSEGERLLVEQRSAYYGDIVADSQPRAALATPITLASGTSLSLQTLSVRGGASVDVTPDLVVEDLYIPSGGLFHGAVTATTAVLGPLTLDIYNDVPRDTRSILSLIPADPPKAVFEGSFNLPTQEVLYTSGRTIFSGPISAPALTTFVASSQLVQFKQPWSLTQDLRFVLSGGATMELSGTAPVHASDVTLRSGAVLTHAAATVGVAHRLDLRATGTVSIDASSSIDVSAKGHLGGHSGENLSDIGLTDSTVVLSAVFGGSYGGYGFGPWSGAEPGPTESVLYGDPLQPVNLGAGGGSDDPQTPGGNGGGALSLQAPVLNLLGTIRANGGSSPVQGTSTYGGSGGSVQLLVGLFDGWGKVLANGSPRGGGGGRISIVFQSSYIPLYQRLEAHGSGETNGGGAGTIFQRDEGNPLGTLLINNGGVTPGVGVPATLLSNLPPLEWIIVTGRAKARVSGGASLDQEQTIVEPGSDLQFDP